MRILIANDDGVDAKGIQTLNQFLSSKYETVLVAPDRNRSGASNSLTLTRTLQPKQVAQGQYSVDGTPSDCVNLAISEVIDGRFDFVVSGINHGPNLGDDVIYSGTVAAAMEARHVGCFAIAVSLVGNKHFDTAAKVIMNLIADQDALNELSLSLPKGSILNVNVPDVEFEQIKGFKVTRLGYRKSAQPAISAQHPKGIPSYWIGALSEPHDEKEGTDFHAINQGYVSITPLHTDMTCYNAMTSISTWLDTPLDENE
ncbi:MAG: 5'/3'-nucleotidase SurE [Marinomonas sp.]